PGQGPVSVSLCKPVPKIFHRLPLPGGSQPIRRLQLAPHGPADKDSPSLIQRVPSLAFRESPPFEPRVALVRFLHWTSDDIHNRVPASQQPLGFRVQPRRFYRQPRRVRRVVTIIKISVKQLMIHGGKLLIADITNRAKAPPLVALRQG